MVKRVLFALVVLAILAAGGVQLSTQVVADPPVDHCARVLCIPCPDGYVLSPTNGNCCRCVRVR